MAIKRMDHVGVIVSDLKAAVAFFEELGLTNQGGGEVGGELVGRIIALDDPLSAIAMMAPPDGSSRVELVEFRRPDAVEGSSDAGSNALGLRHLCFAVDDIDDTVARLRKHGAELVGEIVQYEDIYRLCYLRGPDGIIVEIAEPVGGA